MEKDKEYKCKDCKKVRTILTLGDLSIGCAYCGGKGGFLERTGKGKWKERGINSEEYRMHRFLISGE